MAVIGILELPGVTRERYEQLTPGLTPDGPPDGVLYHACGPAERVWKIIDLWEAEQHFQCFVDVRFVPALCRQGLPGTVRREVVAAHHAGRGRR